ncbi:hypothetical protein MMC08_007838 [Hypocenomyce scalaris]|nr:hypothetical protein [Hypocenomyce scalaris]
MSLANIFNRRNLPLLAITSMGGMYFGVKSRAIMLKREQNAREERQGNYAVSTQRSGEFGHDKSKRDKLEKSYTGADTEST